MQGIQYDVLTILVFQFPLRNNTGKPVLSLHNTGKPVLSIDTEYWKTSIFDSQYWNSSICIVEYNTGFQYYSI